MTTEQDRTLAAAAVAVKVIGEYVDLVSGALRDHLEQRVRPRETVTAVLPNGDEVGQVGRSRPAQRVVVNDEAALLAWVQEHRPDEVITTSTIRTSFLTYLKRQATQLGHAVDESTGEIIPGIEVVEGTSSYRVTPSTEGRAAVLGMLNGTPIEQTLDAALAVLELPAGGKS